MWYASAKGNERRKERKQDEEENRVGRFDFENTLPSTAAGNEKKNHVGVTTERLKDLSCMKEKREEVSSPSKSSLKTFPSIFPHDQVSPPLLQEDQGNFILGGQVESK